MEFPNLVYKPTGSFQRPGGTYSYKAVANEAELNAALEDGWFRSLAEAVEKKAGIAKVEHVEQPAISDAPPTRAEMEAKAKELGIKFDGRTTDKMLLSKIEAVLKA